MYRHMLQAGAPAEFFFWGGAILGLQTIFEEKYNISVFINMYFVIKT